MKLLGFVFLFNLFSSLLLANENLEHTLWMDYKIKKGERISDIARQSGLVQANLVDVEVVIKTILDKNPHIQNPDQIKVGQKLFVPFFVVPKLDKKSGAAIVSYNIYINSNVYNYGSGETIKRFEEPIGTQVRNPTSLVTSETSSLENAGQSSKIEYRVGTLFYYNLLDSKRTVGGNNAKQASGLNNGLQIGLNHKLWKSLRLHYGGHLKFEKYDLANQSLYDVSVKVGLPIFTNFYLMSGLSYGQTPIISPMLAQLKMEFINHPQWDTNIGYSFKAPFETQIQMDGFFNYLLSGTQSGIDLQNGTSFGFNTGIARKLFGQNLSLKAWWQNTSLTTNLTTQTNTSIGSGLWWSHSF